MGKQEMLERLYNQVTTGSPLCDLRLKCEDGVLVAHKSILVASSPVFEAMLTTRFKEAKATEITIDLPCKIMTSILQYMYTQELKTEIEDVWQIFEYAHRNDLDDLLKACTELIYSNAKEGANAVRCYMYGLVYNIEKLAYAGLKFIVEDLPEVSKTDEFGSLEHEKILAMVLDNVKSQGDRLEVFLNWIMYDPDERYDKYYRNFLDFVILHEIHDVRFVGFAAHPFYAERQRDWDFLVLRRLTYQK